MENNYCYVIDAVAWMQWESCVSPINMASRGETAGWRLVRLAVVSRLKNGVTSR